MKGSWFRPGTWTSSTTAGERAIATRVQPDRDITIITNARGSDLDPSSREDGFSGKWGVDATAKPSLAAYTPRHRVPPDVWTRVDPKAFGL